MSRFCTFVVIISTIVVAVSVDAFAPPVVVISSGTAAVARRRLDDRLQPVRRLQQHDDGAFKTTTTTEVLSSSSSNEQDSSSNDNDVLNAAIQAMYGKGEEENPQKMEDPEETRKRIETLVRNNKVLLFMKGSKSFPQCGFSDTATKILESVLQQTDDFAAVDVLTDDAIRQGIKQFSQWPTIPQLYINGEFIGGSDIMLEMYQSGELAQLLLDDKE